MRLAAFTRQLGCDGVERATSVAYPDSAGFGNGNIAERMTHKCQRLRVVCKELNGLT